MSADHGNSSPNPLLFSVPSTSSTTERAPIKTKISLRATTPPFYTMKPNLPAQSSILGSMDLLTMYDLSGAYNKFCSAQGLKRIGKEDLTSFLPHLYGDFNWKKGQEISWLKMLVEKPPITGKEIHPLNASSMASFKMQPGVVDEPYRSLFDSSHDLTRDSSAPGVARTAEKRKFKMSVEPLDEDCIDNWAMEGTGADMGSEDEGGTKKKKKKTDKDREERKERKKEKKEKKEKKNKREKEERL